MLEDVKYDEKSFGGERKLSWKPKKLKLDECVVIGQGRLRDC